jgi:predicted RNA-binding Zn-ribbon protein involved in translation (DUF1610 family)
MHWHRTGHNIQVVNDNLFGYRTFIKGVPQRKPETEQEKTNRENRQHCECIALELEMYAAGEMYACPECGEHHYLPDHTGDKFKCPACGTVADFDEYEQLSLWDHLRDVLDIEYRIAADRTTLNSVRLLVACGGPNIYIDTASRSVELYWWTDRANFPIHPDVCEDIDAMFWEVWTCS